MSKKPKELLPTVQLLTLKEPLLCQELQVTEELVAALRQKGFTVSANVLKKPKNKDRVKLLLEDLKNSCSKREHLLNQLIEVLEDFNPWLGDELQNDYIGELGETKISEALEVENARIVFKEFGNEKRLSEIEKKKLLKLLKRKTQCTRDIWEKQLSRLNRKIEEARLKAGSIDENAARLADEIQKYIELNSAQFSNRGINSMAVSTSELFQSIPPLKRLQKKSKCLIQLAGQSWLEAVNIQNEKDRVAKRISMKDGKGPVDMQLQGVLDDKHNSIVLCKQAIKDAEADAERLVKEIEEADKRRIKELEDKQAIINSMHGKIAVKEKENDDLENYVKQLRKEMAQHQVVLTKFENRAGDLEKNRRLNNVIGPMTSERRSTLIDHSLQLPAKFQLLSVHKGRNQLLDNLNE